MLRETMYKSCMNVLYNGALVLALKKENKRKLQTTEIRMLRLVCGKTHPE